MIDLITALYEKDLLFLELYLIAVLIICCADLVSTIKQKRREKEL